MTLEDVTSFFGSAFSLFMDLKILGIPLLVWIVITSVLGLIGLFVKGTKK